MKAKGKKDCLTPVLLVLILTALTACRSTPRQRQSTVRMTVPGVIDISWVYISTPRDTVPLPSLNPEN